MRAALLVLVIGCGGGIDEPPLEHELGVFWGEPAERPVPSSPPTVYIDGVARMSLATSYESVHLAEGEQHLVELRHGDAVVRSMTVQLGGTCLMRDGGYARVYRQDICALQSGDLRFGSEAGDIHLGGEAIIYCVGDGFCVPSCGATSCTAGQRCTSRVATTSPFGSHLACAPIGPKVAGDSCAMTASPDGAYDDCGDGLLCVAGVCTAARPGCLGDWIPGHAPEVRLCP